MPTSNDTWIAGSADWATAADWSAGTVPNSNDDAVINTTSIQTITHNSGDDTVHSLTVGDDHFVLAGGSLAFLAGASFAFDYRQNGGTLLGAGAVTISNNGYLLGGTAQGTLNFAISGTIALANYTLGGSTTLTNAATTNQTGQITIGDVTGVNATITNAANGVYTINGDYGITQGAASAKLVNAGSLQKAAGSGTSVIGVSVNDTGAISVASGTLQLNGPTNVFSNAISGAGVFTIGGGGTDAFNAGATVTAAGFDVFNADMTLDENLNYANAFAENGGSIINLNGHTLTLSGSANLYNYNFATPYVDGSGTLATSGTTTLDDMVLGGTASWSNSGSVNETGTSQIGDFTGSAATFTNQAAGSFNFANDVNLTHGASLASSFANAGVIAKTGGAGTSLLEVDVVDTGTITASTGTLEFEGPSNSFAGTISGAGQVAIGGGSVNTIAAGTVISVATFNVTDNATSIKLLGNLSDANAFNENYASVVNLNGHTLTLSGAVSLFNTNFGTPTINGSGTLSTSGTVTISDFVLGGTVTWSNGGVVNENQTNFIGDNGAGAATFNNLAAGTFNFTNDSNLERGSTATSTFKNAGALAKTAGTGASYVDVDYTGAGKIMVATGALEFRGPNNTFGGAISGAGQFALGGGGADVIASGTTITASSFAVTDGGTAVTLGGNLSYAGSFSQSFGSSINLNGFTLTLSSQASFFNQNFGTPTVNGSGTLATSGATSVNNFILGGTVNWVNSGVISEQYTAQIGDSGASAATLTNQASGAINFVTDCGISRGASGSSSLVNAGAVTKTGGTGVSVIGLNVTNTGTIESKTGFIDITGALSGTGALKIDAGAGLEFGSSVASGSTVSFAANTGTLKIDSLAAFGGVVSGFVAGDVLDLAGQTVTSMQYNGTILTVTLNNGSTQTLAMASSVLALKAVYDGAGGTDIVATTSPFALTTGTDDVAFVSGAKSVTATASTLTSGDALSGGSGFDTLSLSGGGSFNLAALAAFSLDGVVLATGSNYSVTLGSVDQPNGRPLTVNASALTSSNSATINASAVAAGTLTLLGGAGADTLVGGGGKTTINGEGGNDTLTGGSGANTYVFSTALNAATNDPTITNFSLSSDNIQLAHAIFAALPTGTLPAADFVIGAAATTANQHIIYNSGTGALLYDSDGNGSAAAVQFAQISTGLALGAGYFKVV